MICLLFKLERIRFFLGERRSFQMDRGQKAQQNQGGARGEAQDGACSQSGERPIARRGRGFRPSKESLAQDWLEERRRQARGPGCHRRRC